MGTSPVSADRNAPARVSILTRRARVAATARETSVSSASSTPPLSRSLPGSRQASRRVTSSTAAVPGSPLARYWTGEPAGGAVQRTSGTLGIHPRLGRRGLAGVQHARPDAQLLLGSAV